jgi:hypothetical protein
VFNVLTNYSLQTTYEAYRLKFDTLEDRANISKGFFLGWGTGIRIDHLELELLRGSWVKRSKAAPGQKYLYLI